MDTNPYNSGNPQANEPQMQPGGQPGYQPPRNTAAFNAADINTGQPPEGYEQRRRSTGKLVGLIAVGAIAVLVILLAGSELYLRNHITGCLADNIKSGAKASQVDVSLSKRPMLLQATGKLPLIDIQVEGLNDTPGLSAHIQLKGVEPGGDNRADEATIAGKLTAQGIKDKLAATQVISNPEVTLNPSTMQIEVQGTAVIFPVTISLKPEIKNNEVALTASKASVFGVGVPDDLASQVITAVNGEIPTPKGLTASDLKMTNEEITLLYSGTNVAPADIEAGADTTGTTNCSVF